jgi:transposase-like protein
MRRDADKEKFWRKTMAEAGGSGQSVREFCRERGLKENLFYAWRRELKARDTRADDGSGFVELVRAAGHENRAGVSIRMGERISIVVERGFDAAALRAVLAAVGEVAPA